MALVIRLEDSWRSFNLQEICSHRGASYVQLGFSVYAGDGLCNACAYILVRQAYAFIPPWGWFMRKLGGIPVDRRAPQSLVVQMAEKFKSSDGLVLAVPPEGTRSKVDVWKSGFYHIASESGVPIGLGYLDYDRKLCGLGMFVIPSGNVNEDMNKIRGFYRSVRGKYPDLESVPRLREETQLPKTAA